MGYVVNGVELETDEEGFLLEADFSDEAVEAIAPAEGIKLNDDHWIVVRYLREKFKEDGHTPNFRYMCKDFDEEHPGEDWKKYLTSCSPCSRRGRQCGWPGSPSPSARAGTERTAV